MNISKKMKKRIPLWVCWIAVVLAAWLALTGIGYALSGDITLNEAIGDISITASLPVTYSPQMDGEDYVYDGDGNLLYDEEAISAEDAPAVVAWNFDEDELTLNGEVSAKYKKGCIAPEMNSVKATVVFTNTNASDDMILSFNYSYATTLGTNGKLEGLVSGANVSEIGTVSVMLAHGESKSISLFSGSAIEGVEEVEEGETPPEYGNVVLNLTNIKVTNANQAFTATLVPASNGMYRADFVNADGDSVSYVVTTAAITPELRAEYPDATVVNVNQAIEYKLSGGLTLTDLGADSNFRFDHWQAGSTNLGSDSPATVLPTDGSNVTAFYQQESFINAFTVGSHTYYSWDAAVTDAVSSHNPIILNQNYTFPANSAVATAAGETLGTYVTVNGDGLTYILPAGVRFVVPKSEGDFGNFSNVLPAGVTATTPITHFRTLTIPSGVTLQANGEISVNGDYYCKQPYETVAGGAHGLVSLNQDAKISVANGGKIWCYGFIAGAGEVEIASGGHAAEFLQICDWGGGSAALRWATNTDNLFNAFYFSQYYVQNIEATLKVYEGATTEVAVAITAAGQVANSHAPFIGEGGLFHITEANGYIERTYDAATDRTNYNVHGDMETSGITVGIMQYKLSSDSYVLGINGNLSINVEEGKTTLLNDFMLLPGTQINVSKEAEVEIAQTTTMNVVDQDTGEITQVERPIRLFIVDDYEWNNTIDTTADPLTQLQQLNNGDASYSGTGASATKHQNALPYTIANGDANDEIRGNVTAESATINVDGEATFHSNVFTTNYIGYLYETMVEMLSDPDQRAALEAQYGAATVAWAEGVVEAAYDDSKDKLITGSGTIVNNEPVEGIDGSLNLLTQSGTVKNQVEIPTAGCLVDLNGDGTYSELGTGTYESAGVDPVTGETLWYKNQVTYHLVVIDPTTHSAAGVLPDITRKVGVDYDILTPSDLTVGGQRYAIFGFDSSTIQSYNATTGKMDMQGIPIGFVPADGEIVKDGDFNLAGDSRNRNFTTPASWQALMREPKDLMTYLMSNGVTSGWNSLGFVFADLTVMSNQTWTISDMLSGGLNGEITVYVVAYDNYVAFENSTTGERSESFLPTGLTAAQYTMNAEAIITPTVTNPATGAAVAITPAQSVDETEHTTTVSVTGVDQDLLVSMTAQYTKVNITWRFVDTNNQETVVYEETEIAHPVADPAVSPSIVNNEHAYYLLAENANVKLSNEEQYRFVEGGLPVSIDDIDVPITVTILVDPFDYKLTFTTDTEDATIADVYVKDGDDVTLKVRDIVLADEDKYCFANATVTGTATAEVTHEGAELALTGIGSDCAVAVDLTGYDHLIQYSWSGTVVKYDFVEAGATSSYEYSANTYDYSFTASLNSGSQPLGLVYTPATEGQRAVVSVENVQADRNVSVNPVDFDRALIVSDENGAVKMLCYGNGSDAGNNYRYQDQQYVKNLVNPNGAVIEDHLDYKYAYIRTNGAGYFPVTVQIGTYYHVVEFRYFQPDDTINGTQLTDVDNVALSTKIFVEEENGTVSIDTDDFLASYTAGNKAVQMYETAGDRVFFYLANYSETGDGDANTYDTSADAKTVTVSSIGKNAFVNVIVVPYSNTITVNDTSLVTENLYYVDANGKKLSYLAAGTDDVTYLAGANRVITGISGLSNAEIDATAEELAQGVDSITFTNISGDVAVDVTSCAHVVTFIYSNPWGSTTETRYAENTFTVSLDGYDLSDATATSGTPSIDNNILTVSDMSDRYVTVTVTAREDVVRLAATTDYFNNVTGTSADNKIATIEVTDAAYGVFTVECSKACIVAVTTDAGATYRELIATKVGDSNVYQFNLDKTDFDGEFRVGIMLKGDSNGDGQITARDATRILRYITPGIESNNQLTSLSILAADANGDGAISARDATRILRYITPGIEGNNSINWTVSAN